MRKEILTLILFLQIFCLILNQSSISLEIQRSRSHFDQTGKLTPLVVSLSSEDKIEKIKGVDLICIVDVSGSMSSPRNKIELVKESLKYLVNLMNEEDNLALVTFDTSSKIVKELTKMTSENKTILLKDIDNLYASGGTNIYQGLDKALSLIATDYSNGERIASMILLSDGIDNYSGADTKFIKLLSDTGKNNYTFTLHTFGYGNDHDPLLLTKIARIRDSGFFPISQLIDVQEAYLKIYGSLSTICYINTQLIIESNFKIEKVYGMDEMYNTTFNNKTAPYSFSTTLIQVIYGKTYGYVVMVDIPEDTPIGTEVLKATISPLGITANYLWENSFNIIAYEEYIRCISVTYFYNGYYAGTYGGIIIIKNGKLWIETNYNGTRNWVGEFDDAINDLNHFSTFGKANLLSKIRELKTNSIGMHYSQDNSYIRNIIDSSHNIDVSKLPITKVIGQKIIDIDININYYYFYLKEGVGEINNLYFSGNGSSLIIYTEKPSGKINITSTSEYIEYYSWNETKKRVQNLVDFSHGGKFIIEKDFPFEFYSKIDGKKDVTFNIEFLKLDFDEISNTPEHLFEINAYILDDKKIENLKLDINSLPSETVYKGYYDDELLLGKIVIKKEEISKQLNSIYQNYLYIIINKISTNKNIKYNHVEGQFIFYPMDYIYSTIPERFSIFSNLFENQKNPHLYTLLGKNITIEFSNLGDELDFKILKYNHNYPTGSEELFIDSPQFNIQRNEANNKTYINSFLIEDNNSTSDKMILSIFSKNEGHIASSNSSYSSYNFKYFTNPYIRIEKNSTENSTNNYTENYTENSTESIEVPKINPKSNVIFLGFSKFVYIRTIKISYFSMHFAHVREIIYSEILIITVNIKYKIIKRRLEENEIKQIECKLVNTSFENQDKYNCSFETNGEEIDNIQIDNNFVFKDQEVEIVGKTPFALKYMNNLQNVGNTDIFNKKLYILDNATNKIDNDKKELNITGIIDDESFNIEELNLTINSYLANDKDFIIPCKIIDNKEKNYTLKCNSNDDIKGHLDGAFGNLGNENLIINYLDNSNNNLNFTSFEPPINKINNTNSQKNKKGLSTGGIIGIIVSCVAVLVIVTTIIVCCKYKRKPVQNESNISANIKNELSDVKL